ncbi:MAG: hypothetical protein QM654_14015 [Dysgonamonadaceae bacterium]
MSHENTLRKARIVADIVVEHYEAGRQDRCLEWCYRNVVNAKHPMSLRTFKRYIEIAVKEFGYCFGERDGCKDYLFDMYTKMQPETKKKVRDLSQEVLRVKTKGDTKKTVYNMLVNETGLELTFSYFNRYLLIAENCMNYKFNF